ncbi:oxidoreductase FAD/NAD(P)-binding domain protein [Methylocella silvestris BL2]|uniref:Oxidoreductase FAD/NAD(P)-binding domain protein n=2 Tax=Methylocella silvestris TaxID=199596 RepID=B8EPN1_METSB|nr:FAD-binding oxidoreductase [Methylocella silvestris]ACK50236.1 oxidoreductase FAD/NAD(P)-binding domain protein [Methylocella silvestris BL2]CAJ26296.1 protein C of soluble methane monooxygenase [Methylocella silvestris BL2]
MFKVRAITEDQHDLTFECSPSEDVISAGLKRDVILLASCREGGCATCKAEIVDGDYELGGCSVQALPPDEEEAGVVLLCRTFPRSDLVLQLPYTFDRISFHKVNTDWQGEIVAVERISSNVARLQIEPKDPETGAAISIPFVPGQYVDIEIPGSSVSRSYSMATTSTQSRLDFLIRLLPDGQFSNFLTMAAKPGLTVKLRGPFGAFNLRENGFRPRYFVAGGTGLSPVLSMIRYMQQEQHPQEAKLFFGVTHQHELFYLEELKKLEESMPNFSAHVAVMQPDGNWQGSRGTVVDDLLKHLEGTKAAPDIYMCGPPGMIDATFAAAANYGVPKDHVYVEKFLATGQNQAAE